jgi:hypothetical protein
LDSGEQEMSRPTQVYVYVAGQLGNQLFQRAAGEYVQAISTERYSGLRFLVDASVVPTLAVDQAEWTSLGAIESKFFGFLLSRGTRTKNSATRLKVSIARHLLKILLLLKFRRWFQIHVSNSIDEAPPPCKRSTVLIGYFQGLFWTTHEEIVRDRMVALVEPFLQPCDLPVSDVFIHMRFTDYFTSSDLGVLSEEYFLDALQLIQDRFQISRVIVCTDDWSTAATLASGFQYRTEVLNPREVDAAMAFSLLSQSKIKIIANSSFSWWAAYLGPQDSFTIYPDPWFQKIQGISKHPRMWISVFPRWLQPNSDIAKYDAPEP